MDMETWRETELKEETKTILHFSILLSILIFLSLLLLVPNFMGFLLMRGEVNGQFISGYHRGFGDEYGEYPFTRILMNDCYPVPTVYKDFIWHDDGTPTPFNFGNDYSYVDKMVVGEYYKINYHGEFRPSDANAGSQINYWVIDSIEKIYVMDK